MTIHICKYCNYSTIYLTAYNKHIDTQKHKNNLTINKNINTNITKIINTTDEAIDQYLKDHNCKDCVISQNEELRKEIEEIFNTGISCVTKLIKYRSKSKKTRKDMRKTRKGRKATRKH